MDILQTAGTAFHETLQSVNKITAIVSITAKSIGWLIGLGVYGLIMYRLHKQNTSSHMPSKNLILPVYRPAMLFVQIVMLLYLGLYVIVAVLGHKIQFSTIVLWSMLEILCEGFTLVLLQGSVGYQAQSRAAVFLCGWIIYAICMGLCAINNLFFDVTLWSALFHFIPSLFHLYIAIPWRADVVTPKRQTLRAYSTWMWFYRFIYSLFFLFQYFTYVKGYTSSLSSLIVIFFILIIIAELPFVLLFYAVLIADTRYWHLGGRLMSRGTNPRRKPKNQQGFDVARYLDHIARENERDYEKHHYTPNSQHQQQQPPPELKDLPTVTTRERGRGSMAIPTTDDDHHAILIGESDHHQPHTVETLFRKSDYPTNTSQPRQTNPTPTASTIPSIIFSPTISTQMTSTASPHPTIPSSIILPTTATTSPTTTNPDSFITPTSPLARPPPSSTTATATLSYGEDEKNLTEEILDKYLQSHNIGFSLTVELKEVADFDPISQDMTVISRPLVNHHVEPLSPRGNDRKIYFGPDSTTPTLSPSLSPQQPNPIILHNNQQQQQQEQQQSEQSSQHQFIQPPPPLDLTNMQATAQYRRSSQHAPVINLSSPTTAANNNQPSLMTPTHGNHTNNVHQIYTSSLATTTIPTTQASQPHTNINNLTPLEIHSTNKSTNNHHQHHHQKDVDNDDDYNEKTSLATNYKYASDDSLGSHMDLDTNHDDDYYPNENHLGQEDDHDDLRNTSNQPLVSFVCCSFECLDMLSHGLLSLLYADDDADTDVQEGDGVLGRTDLGVLSDANDDIVQGELQDLIEQNSGHLVHYLQLRLDHSRLLGAGSYSKVFGGEISLNSHQIRERRKYIPSSQALYISFYDIFSAFHITQRNAFWIAFQQHYQPQQHDYSGFGSGANRDARNSAKNQQNDLQDGYTYGSYHGRDRKRRGKMGNTKSKNLFHDNSNINDNNNNHQQPSLIDRSASNLFTTSNAGYDTYFDSQFDEEDDQQFDFDGPRMNQEDPYLSMQQQYDSDSDDDLLFSTPQQNKELTPNFGPNSSTNQLPPIIPTPLSPPTQQQQQQTQFPPFLFQSPQYYLSDIIRPIVFRQQQQQLQQNFYKLTSSLYSTSTITPLVPTKSLLRRMASTQSLTDFLVSSSKFNNINTSVSPISKQRPLPLWRHIDQIAMLDTIGLWGKQWSMFALLVHQQIIFSPSLLSQANLWLYELEGQNYLQQALPQCVIQSSTSSKLPSNSSQLPSTLLPQAQQLIADMVKSTLQAFINLQGVTSIWTKSLGVKEVKLDPDMLTFNHINILSPQSSVPASTTLVSAPTFNAQLPSTLLLSPPQPLQQSFQSPSSPPQLGSPIKSTLNSTLLLPQLTQNSSNHLSFSTPTITPLNSTPKPNRTPFSTPGRPSNPPSPYNLNNNVTNQTKHNNFSTLGLLPEDSTTNTAGTDQNDSPNQNTTLTLSTGHHNNHSTVISSSTSGQTALDSSRKLTLSIAAKFFLRTAELDIATVKSFSQETILHSSLKHSNIVWLYGLCVVPPAIAIISEECRRGCLIDLIEQQIKFKTALLREIIICNTLKQRLVDMYLKARPDQFLNPKNVTARENVFNHFSKSQHRLIHIGTFLWSLRDRLCLAKDCAAGIAYIHKKKILHRDIKTPNYLLTDDMRVKLTDFGISRHVDLSFEDYYSLQSVQLQKRFGIENSINLITNKQRKQIMVEWHLQSRFISPTSNQTPSSSSLTTISTSSSSKSPIPLHSLTQLSTTQNLKRQAERIQTFTAAVDTEQTLDDDEIAIIDVHTQVISTQSNYHVLQQIDDLSALFGAYLPTGIQRTDVDSVFQLLSTTSASSRSNNGYKLLRSNPLHVDFSSSEAVLYHLRQNLQRVSSYASHTPAPIENVTSTSADSQTFPQSLDHWAKFSSLSPTTTPSSSLTIKSGHNPNIITKQQPMPKPQGIRPTTLQQPQNQSQSKPFESINDSYYSNPMYTQMNFTFQTEQHFLFPLIVENPLISQCQQKCQQTKSLLTAIQPSVGSSIAQSSAQTSTAMKQYSTYRTMRKHDTNLKRQQQQQHQQQQPNDPHHIPPTLGAKTNSQSDLFSNSVAQQHLTSNMGTAVWMAPEVWMIREDNNTNNNKALSNKQAGVQYSYPADIYSLGIVLYELLCLQPPPPTLPESLSSTNYPDFQLFFPDDVPFYIRQLILACLSFDPNKRPSAVDIVNVLTIFIELVDAYHLYAPN